MDDLAEGLRMFHEKAFPQRAELFKELAHSQAPNALFIACADSRVVPELLTQREPGEMFVNRNAGNIVPSYGFAPGGVSATIEYAVAVLKVRDIVVCGHSDCGAMTAVAHDHDLSALPAVRSWLRHADAAKAINNSREHASPEAKLAGMVRENVIAQLANIRTHPSVALALSQGGVNLHGWVYDIESGQVEAFDGATGRFVSFTEHPEACAEAAWGRGKAAEPAQV